MTPGHEGLLSVILGAVADGAAAAPAAAEELPFYYRLMHVDSPAGVAWFAVGFVGEVVFAGRMVVQWIESERRKQSVVTPLFWWMSLVGAAMLILYFAWRKDLVGVFGQFAIFIYVRNLMLIARHKEREALNRSHAEGSDQP